MRKAFRINLDLEFSNGQVLTVEHEASGVTIDEACNSARSDLALRMGAYLTRIYPINYYEQIDPLPEDEAEAEGRSN